MSSVTSPLILNSTGLQIAAALDDVADAISAEGGTPSIKAQYDETPALYAHAVDDIIYFNSHFYKVTQAISVGDSIVVDTNITADTGIEADTVVYVTDLPDASDPGTSLSFEAVTISSSGWSSNVYSFESDYPSASYDILDITPAEAATDAERKAWISADCGGYRSTNTIYAHGTVPSITIPVVLLLRAK